MDIRIIILCNRCGGTVYNDPPNKIRDVGHPFKLPGGHGLRFRRGIRFVIGREQYALCNQCLGI